MSKQYKSSLPTTQEELICKLHSAYELLDQQLENVSEQDSRLKTLEGNLSVNDILAYQIGWGHLLLGWEFAEAKGEKAAMPAKGYKWNQLRELAESFYTTYQQYSLQTLRELYSKVVFDVIAWIHSLSTEELYLIKQRAWAGDKWPLVKWIQVNTIAPYMSARKKIRKWKQMCYK